MSKCSHICYIVSVLLQPKSISFSGLVSPRFFVNYNNTETLEGTWFNCLFSLLFKLTKTEVRAILIKTCSYTMQRIYTRGVLQGRSLINSMHAPSTTPLFAFLVFTYLTVKDYYKLFEFLNDTLLDLLPEVLILEHLNCLNKVF